MAQYGKYGRIDAAIGHFVYDHLEGLFLGTNPPKIINLSYEFAAFLVNSGVNKLVAQENAEKYITTIVDRISNELDEWKNFTERCPIAFLPESDKLISWCHHKKNELIGDVLHSEDYVKSYRNVLQSGPRQFLFIIAVYLARTGFDKIFLTDGSGDMGTDLLARQSAGAFENVILFVQSKTLGSDRIGSDILLQEYGKMKACPATDKFRYYLDLVDNNQSRCGSGRLFGFFSNREFRSGTRVHAANLGVLLRSGRQITHCVGASGVALAYALFQAYQSHEIAVKPTDNLKEFIDIFEMQSL